MCVTQAHGTFVIFLQPLIVNKYKEVGSGGEVKKIFLLSYLCFAFNLYLSMKTHRDPNFKTIFLYLNL